MDIRVNDFSFKGAPVGKRSLAERKIASLILAATMGFGISAYSQNTEQKDYFSKDTEYVALPSLKNKEKETKEILTPLRKTNFFQEKDTEIISSILSSMGVESLGCISSKDNFEAFGECSTALYKFYVRKAKDGTYYGFVDKLVGMDSLDLVEFQKSKNKSYAFEFKNPNPDASSASIKVSYAEMKRCWDKYSNSFIFGNEDYNKTRDIKKFRKMFLKDGVKSNTYTIE